MKNFASLISALALLALSLAPLNAVANVSDSSKQTESHAVHHGSNDEGNQETCASDQCKDTVDMCCDIGLNHCTGAAVAFRVSESVPFKSQSVLYTKLNDTLLGLGTGLEPPPPRI